MLVNWKFLPRIIVFTCFTLIVFASCNRSSSYVLSGHAANSKQSHFNPVSQKSQPIPKKFVIKNGRKTYLGQIK